MQKKGNSNNHHDSNNDNDNHNNNHNNHNNHYDHNDHNNHNNFNHDNQNNKKLGKTLFALDVNIDSISMQMQPTRVNCMGNIGCETLLCFRKVVHLIKLFSYDNGSS